MLRIVRKVSEKTGESEEKCMEWLKEEMRELEEEVLAIKRLLSCGSEATKVEEAKKPKKAPKKKTQTQAAVAVTAEASEAATVVSVEEPKKPKKAPKKKAQAAVAVTAEASEAATVVSVEEAKKPKKAPKKKAQAAVAVAVAEEVLDVVVEAVATGSEEEVEVEEIEYQGVRYLKSVKGVVYDIETSEEIGIWNEERKSIEVE